MCDVDFSDASTNLEEYCDCSGCACYSGGAAPKPRNDDDGDDAGSIALYLLVYGLVFTAVAAVVFGIVRRWRRRGVVSAFRPFARFSSPDCSGCCSLWRRLVAEEAGAYAPLGGNINVGGSAGHSELTIARRSLAERRSLASSA